MQLTELLEQSVKQHASDLHLSSGMPPICRIDGDLTPMPNMPVLDADTTKTLIYSIMNNEQQKEIEELLELDFAVLIPGVANFRVNAFYQTNGMAAVFRAIPENTPTLDQLELPP